METGLSTEQVDRLFSEILIHSAKEKKLRYDLRSDAPVMDLIHPKVLRALLDWLNNPGQDQTALAYEDGFISFFSNPMESQLNFPRLEIQKAYPAAFSTWTKKHFEVIWDFEGYGSLVFSHSQPGEISNPMNRAMLIPWIRYAASPELWGEQGKWTRFHERLRTLFTHFLLLKESTAPGSYTLKPEAKVIEKHLFFGSEGSDGYTLNLPWTFPLTALEALEKAVTLEFSHVHPKIS